MDVHDRFVDRMSQHRLEMVRGMVGNGLGYALLVTKPDNNMTYDGKALVTRPIKEPITPGRIVMAQLRGRSLSAPATAFRDHCTAFFADFNSKQAA